MAEHHVFEGDEWKHADDDPPRRLRGKMQAQPRYTRVEMQRQSNLRFAFGIITLEQWRAEFDYLSKSRLEFYPSLLPPVNPVGKGATP